MLGYLVRYYYDFRRHFAMNLVEEDDIRSLVWVGETHGEIASLLQAQFSTVQRGFSERNVREYCRVREIRKPRAHELDTIVRQCVSEVGITYIFFVFDSISCKLVK